MNTFPHRLAIAALAAAAAFAGAAAQTADQDLDLEAIRARAAQQAGEADALAATARARAEQMLDLIDNRFGDALQDQRIGSVLEQLREAYAERIDVAEQVAQECGYQSIDLQ